MKIIAEVGSNWRSIDDCIKSISLAKSCGADVVKFQLFTHQELYGWQEHFGYELPKEWLKTLRIKANAAGIEFMCTPFSVEGIEILNPYVQRFKIASSNLTHLEMLRQLNNIGKPVILSTGGHSINDAALAMKILKDCEVTLLYCVSEYPAKFINFDKMDRLRELCPRVGFSDHSTDILVIPNEAKRRGALIIEKHVNLAELKQGPDVPHSLLPNEFKLMCDSIHGKSVQLDLGENDMRTNHNVRCIAMEALRPGDLLQYGVNFGLFRSKVVDINGLHGFAWEQLEGATVKRDLYRGEGIGPKDVNHFRDNLN